MPGLDFYKTPESKGPSVVSRRPSFPVLRLRQSPAPVLRQSPVPETPIEGSNRAAIVATPSPEAPLKAGVYYNPRLDPKNFLEGPLSWDPATRLRQMLARPGIIVRTHCHGC